jgi:hypothetical protein
MPLLKTSFSRHGLWPLSIYRLSGDCQALLWNQYDDLNGRNDWDPRIDRILNITANSEYLPSAFGRKTYIGSTAAPRRRIS